MKQLGEFKNAKNIKYFFTDIDDTLTEEGRLPESAYRSLWHLHKKGLHVIPVTGRPAGWCEMIARMWPVDGVIGENGAFYFRYKDRKMHRQFVFPEEERKKNQIQLKKIENEVLTNIPGTALASDQFCRLFDLAIDFCEDVPPLDKPSIQKIVETFTKHGATAKVSSIHVNGWFGTYNKLSMCKTYLQQEYQKNLDEIQGQCLFIGDSPNDEPLFASFENSFAVSNITDFLDLLKSKPKYITTKPGGIGFTEVVDLLF